MDSQRINVGDKFRRQNMPSAPALQPPDYTSYPQGAKKIGLISQVGLMKRKADARSYKTRIALADVVKGGTSPVVQYNAKPLPNKGILSGIDKFFSWLNRVIGV